MFNKLCAFLNNESGEAYTGEAIKIVIAVVIGAALLVGTLVIFKDTIMPQLRMRSIKLLYTAYLWSHGVAMTADQYLEADWGEAWDWDDDGVADTWDDTKDNPSFWDMYKEDFLG